MPERVPMPEQVHEKTDGTELGSAGADASVPSGAVLRAVAVTLGVGAAAVFGALLGAALEGRAGIAVLAALTGGIAAGFAAASYAVLAPAARDQASKRDLVERFRALASPQRADTLDTLLDVEHACVHLSALTSAAHAVLVAARRDRVDAANLRREMESRIEREAQAVCANLGRLSVTDELTGLLNRRGFEPKLEELIESARPRRQEVSLLAIDLDGFKSVNDTLGHATGDRVLVAAAALLQEQVRDRDVAARVGGDELFLALYGSGPDGALRVARRLVEAMAEHIIHDELEGLRPGLSVGVASYRAHGASSAADLRRMADHALYDAKRAGRGRAAVYGEAGEEAGRQRGAA